MYLHQTHAVVSASEGWPFPPAGYFPLQSGSILLLTSVSGAFPARNAVIAQRGARCKNYGQVSHELTSHDFALTYARLRSNRLGGGLTLRATHGTLAEELLNGYREE